MLTIITPCSRPARLLDLAKSIQFDLIDRWIIVYDTSRKRTYEHQFTHNPKVLEVECDTVGSAGHAQRNCGMTHTRTRMVYFLDDDNIIHPNFWKLLPRFQPGRYYTFDQLRNHKTGAILCGPHCIVGRIDTAQFVVDMELVQAQRWMIERYDADGYFIQGLHSRHPTLHTYIPEVACYYNYLTT